MLSPLESLTSPDFWSAQVATVFNAWAILAALILVFWAAHKIKLAKTNKELSALKAYTEAIESRLQLARDLNSETNRLAELRAEIDGLRQLINTQHEPQNEAQPADKGAKGKLVEVGLKDVDASVASLAMANRTTNHILTSERLALGDLDKKHNLRLVPRPSSSGKGAADD